MAVTSLFCCFSIYGVKDEHFFFSDIPGFAFLSLSP